MSRSWPGTTSISERPNSNKTSTMRVSMRSASLPLRVVFGLSSGSLRTNDSGIAVDPPPRTNPTAAEPSIGGHSGEYLRTARRGRRAMAAAGPIPAIGRDTSQKGCCARRRDTQSVNRQPRSGYGASDFVVLTVRPADIACGELAVSRRRRGGGGPERRRRSQRGHQDFFGQQAARRAASVRQW